MSGALQPPASPTDSLWVRLARRGLAWSLPFCLVACGGQGCQSCATPNTPKVTPETLLLPEAAQVRLTQHGFDVVAGQILSILKAILGTNASGLAVVDVAKVLGGPLPPIQGGLGLFAGQGTVRDLVLTLDLAGIQVALVEDSKPARVRITLDHAQVGVQQGIVSGKASFAGLESDAACQLENGLDVGLPSAHLATLSAQLDLVLHVDAEGKLQLHAEVVDPVLHDVGFALAKDCALKECTDQAMGEPPCLECDLCATGQLASGALAGMKQLLEPVLGQLLQAAGNLLVEAVLADKLNGQPLDLERAVDLKAMLEQASPLIGSVLGPSNPLMLRGRPSPAAFSVVDLGLQGKFDAAVFAQAHPCVPDAGQDTTLAFGQLVQGAAPQIPQVMQQVGSDGQGKPQAVDLAVVLGRNALEEATWAVTRSGLLCLAVDSRTLHSASGGKLVLSTGLADLVLPGLRRLAGADAPLRIQAAPSARPQDAPVVTLAQQSDGSTQIKAILHGIGLRIEALMRGRWLTVAELKSDAVVRLSVQVVAGRLRLAVEDAQVQGLEVVGEPTFAHAGLEVLAPAVAQAVTAVLLAKPLEFELDLQSMLTQALSLPLTAQLIAVEAGGDKQDWLVMGLGLQAGAQGAP